MKMDTRNANALDATTRAASVPIATASPIVAYEFPCSYFGTPQPIASTLPSSLLGQLLPPIQQQLQVNLANNNDRNKNATEAKASLNDSDGVGGDDGEENNESKLSCLFRAVDGIASKTILQSEGSIADLRTQVLEAHNTTTSTEQQPTAPALAVEVWFTPILARQEGRVNDNGDVATEYQLPPLLPIVSIAAPISNNTNNSSSSSSNHPIWGRDPCEGRQLVIGQRGEFLELYYRDYYEYLSDNFYDDWDDDDGNDDYMDYDSNHLNDSSQYACRILRLTEWKLGEGREEHKGEATTADRDSNKVAKLHHLVVAWKESGSILQVFGNGNFIVDLDMLSAGGTLERANTNPDFLRSWDPSYRLQLFSDSRHWSGTTIETPEVIPTTKNNGDGDGTSTQSNVKSNTDTDTKSIFPGTIHRVALYSQDLDEENVNNLYHEGVKKREKDPSKTFFDDSGYTFEPLRLVASTITPAKEHSIMGASVVQGFSVAISVGGMDVSNSTTSLWDTMVEIVKIPLYGDLVGPENSIVRAGDRIPLAEGHARTGLIYQHVREDYFSVPRTSFHGTPLPNAGLPDESFSYRLIAVPKGNDNPESDREVVLLGRSETVRQELIILHRNHPPSLQGLPQEVVVPDWQSTASSARPWATLGNETVLSDEVDYDIDRVKIDLWTLNGTLTIDLEKQELRAIAEITNCANPSPPPEAGMDWICDGQKDRNMTFLATPSDVSRILSNVKYTSLHWNQRDTIFLKISDGNGAPCLGDDDRHSLYFLPNTTIRDDCFQTIAGINVPAISFPEGQLSESYLANHTSWWSSLLVFFFVLFCACCCAGCCVMKFRRDKKLNNVAVEEHNSPVILASPTSDDDFDFIGISKEDKEATEFGTRKINDVDNV
uniref:Uncharacterized protein n=1 Tax=Pseudo-nitzschia australis TaxID=44445 RepID=A0A7S4EME1_9STRA